MSTVRNIIDIVNSYVGVALAFGGYLRNFFDVPVGASALALLAVCTAFSIWGLRESSWLNIADSLLWFSISMVRMIMRYS